MKKFFMRIITFSMCITMLTVNISSGMIGVNAKEEDLPKYSSISARGVWHRPNSSGRENTLEGLCSVLDEMASAGINLVFLESFYHGMTIFKTNLVPYYTGFEDFDFGEYPDYMTAFVTEAKKRGIEVHAWVECFYLGVNESTPLVKYFPDWLLVNESGSIRHKTEGAQLGGYIFFDPASEGVRCYLLSFYDEMLTRVPELCGLNLDYIRYPVSDFYSGTDTGYTDASMSGFAQDHGLFVSESNNIKDFKSQIKDNSLVEEWIDYCAQQVTCFVEQVHNMVSEKHRECVISVAVHPDIDSAYKQKKQDFVEWINRGYIDVVAPMAYYYDAGQISSVLKAMLSEFKGVYCYSGLYTTYHDQSTAELERHIMASEACYADGFVLFESAKTFFNPANDYFGYLSDKYGKGAGMSALPHWSADRLIYATSDIIVKKLLENGVSDESIGIIADEMARISRIGEGSEEKLDQMILEIAQLRDDTISAITEEYPDLNVEKDMDLLLEYLEIRRLRLSYKGYDGIEDMPDNDMGGPDNDDYGQPGEDDDGSLEQPGDLNNKKSIFDIIAAIFERIINWFRELFRS